MITAWTCTTTGASTTDCIVTASTTPFQGVGYHDWLFVAVVIVAMLGLMVWPRIFRPIKDLFYYDN